MTLDLLQVPFFLFFPQILPTSNTACIAYIYKAPSLLRTLPEVPGHMPNILEAWWWAPRASIQSSLSGMMQCSTRSHLTTNHTLFLTKLVSSLFPDSQCSLQPQDLCTRSAYLYVIPRPPSSFCISSSLLLVIITSFQISTVCSCLFWLSHSTLKTTAIPCPHNALSFPCMACPTRWFLSN